MYLLFSIYILIFQGENMNVNRQRNVNWYIFKENSCSKDTDIQYGIFGGGT